MCFLLNSCAVINSCGRTIHCHWCMVKYDDVCSLLGRPVLRWLAVKAGERMGKYGTLLVEGMMRVGNHSNK